MAVLAAVILVAGSVLAHDRLGGWTGLVYSARLYYLQNVPPLFWPNEPFAAESWHETRPEDRYRFAKSLLHESPLVGASVDEVTQLLGGDIPATANQFKYALRRCDFQNLWWVLVLEFENRQCKSVRHDLAWLDP